MSSPKSRRATSASPGVEIEKHREEGNWRKCLELAKDTSNRNEWEQPQLRNFITGEAKLELLLEEFSKQSTNLSSSLAPPNQTNNSTNTNSNSTSNFNSSTAKVIDEAELNEARKCLLQCIEGHDDSPLLMDANLLLAKAAYISGNFQEALQYIRTSGIDHIVNIDKKLPPRVIKLIAESLSVKGMSLEKISPRKKLKFIDHSFDLLDEVSGHKDKDRDHKDSKRTLPQIKESEVDYESYKTQSECLTKAAALGIRYIQIIDKAKGQYFVANLGHILETTILKSHHCFIRNGHINEAIDYCRRMLNYAESQSLLTIRQIISKELSELLVKGLSRSAWRKPDCGIQKQALLTVYYGNSIFTPNEYEEELMLLLMLSEALTSRNVVLERSTEFEEPRIHSLNDVLLIQDLYTIVFTPFQQFFIENYERAMKFSYEVKHIWFQFALTLIESGQQSLRALRVLKEVSRMDPLDPVPNLIAAKLCMTELMMFDEAITLLNDALIRYQRVITNDSKIKGLKDTQVKDTSRPINSLVNNIKEIYGGSNLLHRIHLWLGIGHALVCEYDTETSKKDREQYYKDSLNHLNESIKFDENGNDHLPFFHMGLHMANQRALNETIKYSRVALLLNPTHLPSIQLLILALTGRRAYKEALELCEATLFEYPEHLILFYIKAHLQEVISDNGREAALMTAKSMLKQWRTIQSKERKMSKTRVSCTNTFMPNISYDTMSLRMEQTLSEVISMDSVPIHNDANSMSDKRFMSQASSINGLSTHLSLSNQHNSWAFEIQIWLMIIDLFLKLDQISEAEICVNDGAVAVFGSLSHQLMYVKGLISKKKGQLLEAKINFQNAISINPKHAKALQQLGHTYYLLGNQISADKYLKDSLNVDSTLHETWSYMGLVLDAIGEHERAFDCHQTAIQLEETSPLLPFNLISRNVLF